jgi:hypothetical protein
MATIRNFEIISEKYQVMKCLVIEVMLTGETSNA